MKKETDLSLVIACYNEEKVLEDSVKEITRILDISKYGYEIIFVDDCSKDNTRELIKKIISNKKNMLAIFHGKNQGRGKTVTDGILAAKGRIVGYIDIDLETPAGYILSLVSEIDRGADIATAWRHYKFNFFYLHRWILSKGYSALARMLLGIKLHDTETGCKFFNRKRILPMLKEAKDTGWFWDTEIMVRPYYKGYRIVELPTLFIRKGKTGSTVRIFSDTKDYFFKLFSFALETRNLRK